uniref:UL130 n=1 Tax=Schistocephalus solidus TaxID=70667 RepID=A0A183SCV6_SCHSO
LLLITNNSTLQLSGSVTVPISFKDKTIRHRFLVSSKIKWNVILVCDFFKRYDHAINFSPTYQSLIITDNKEAMQVNNVNIDTPPPIEPSSIEDILTDNISASDRQALYHVLVPFRSVFTWADQAIGRTDIMQHRLTPDPIRGNYAPTRHHTTIHIPLGSADDTCQI